MTATERALELTRAAATAAVDKLGTDLIAYDVSEQLAITRSSFVEGVPTEREFSDRLAVRAVQHEGGESVRF